MNNNSTQRLVPNPINVYQVGKYSPGIKHNSDGSLDIYVQPQNPGQAKQNTPTNNQLFNLLMRLYWPDLLTVHGRHHQYSAPIQPDSQSELWSSNRDTDVSYYSFFILSYSTVNLFLNVFRDILRPDCNRSTITELTNTSEHCVLTGNANNFALVGSSNGILPITCSRS